MILLLHLIVLLYCGVITWYYPLALKVFRMGMGPLQWNETHSSGGDKGFSQCGMKWNLPHLFGVEVVAVLSMGVPVLDTDSGPPLTAADFRDAVVPQSRGDFLIWKAA